MNLHEDKELFVDAVSITAQQMGLPEIYVEKDYWVTLALQRIFSSPSAEYTIFKGGTALSKCFNFINRFSEDVDLVLRREEGLSANQLRHRLKRVSNVVSDVLPEIDVEGITNKKGMIRKTAHTYSKVFKGDFGQARDLIILESSWLGASEPTIQGQVVSFIGQMMQEQNQADLIEKYGLQPFTVTILAPERTLCEKIISLVRFSNSVDPVTDLRMKIRHIYDLHQLLKEDNLSDFLTSSEFEMMLNRVGQDDDVSLRNNKEWLYIHPSQAMLFSALDQTWPKLSGTYTGTFKTLVYGDLPEIDDVKKTLQRIKDRLQTMEWKLEAGD
ncbi:nucleotidyltransferase AbiEii toxin of type IV toxin-antitoxin system [Algoriphagus ratkowskyi]|uniref:Nucleotidyl transferase AbiEii/AbiGii toxin family protein n=2 Tax=Algoriphagus ratkowskyi TaxID=57028 RepID=A0A2W7R9M9_9BACT|nr:nucleotidyltransferase AbiEii toxin of type IV toxin-antitoxin system [Algoriphagus ratkowskyi]TXD79095.1 nucleotidyl transferase AbiEii/AbiGii toxin family protein [Algoriphagus ratkowskyi]